MGKISVKGFPNPFAPKKVKDSDEYGLAFAKAIDKASKNSYFDARNTKFRKCQEFARGEQPSAPYMDWMNIDGKQPFTYLDFTPSPIAKKLIDTVVSKYMDIEEEIRATSIDLGSIKKKDQQAREAKYRMEFGENVKQLEQLSGDKFEDADAFTPETDEELELWKQTMLRTKEEIIIETAMSLIFHDNDIKEVKRKLLYDFCVKGVGATKVYLDPNNRIRFRDVNMYNLVHSFSQRNDFKDLSWAAEYIPMKISELRQRWKLKESTLYDLAMNNKGKYGNPTDYLQNTPDPFGMYQYDDFTVMVQDFAFKTTIEKIYQHKVSSRGKEFLDRVNDDFKETEKKKKIVNYDNVVYQGYWIVGTDYLLNYGLSKNLLKPNSNSKEVFLPYVIYMYDNVEMKNKSMVEMAVAMIRQLDLTYLKIQQMVARARPAGLKIDITALEDVDLGLGGALSPLELEHIADQTGHVYYRSRNEEGEPLNTSPIEPIVLDVYNNINALISVWNFHFERLREYIGLNEYVDSSSINPRVGARVVENQVKASNNAIRYIYDSYENIIERTAGLCAIQFWDLIVFGESDYVDIIGEENAKFIRESKEDLCEIDFNIKFDAVTNAEEAQLIETDIQTALTNQIIDLKDAREIRRIKNYKLASIYLEIAREKKRKRDLLDAKQKSEDNANANAQAGVMVEQERQKSEAMKKDTAVSTELAKGEAQIEKSKLEFIQDIIQDSVNNGVPIPDFLRPIVEQYLAEIFPAPPQPEQAPADELVSKQGDLLVMNGEIHGEPGDGEVQYIESPSGAEMTEDGLLVIPAEGAEQYIAASIDERIALEEMILQAEEEEISEEEALQQAA